ncbi:helix-turn-helix transcriptional regulator [Pseudonocardia asaccharolytica]|uniref:ArsR family transcriptional regulator n=1 Tax=Pseudonocardia asaccharolytica DSM 44247 = NBRC 16224 TaxID=1123024 RepID=A0A511D4B3_9PSEU|nr:helix-turn-helix domain-containing protein [Pseudonocardia asaccharolytica]GEL17748.1 ArsR family transcriptional regulator [Pseudonocardia asaccharolytica DSM 44247 = NBRC 16224]
MDDEGRRTQIAAVAALAEPTRHRLYDHVVRQPGSVSRDEAAAAVGLPRTTAAFHLDRLVDEGLLEVVYERRTGRTGPGAGRPAKLYRRAACQVVVSLPERRYDLAGKLLAGALVEVGRSGEAPRVVLGRRAHRLGMELARGAGSAGACVDSRMAALRVLGEHGFEPRAEGGGIALVNCPFHALVQEHPNLVCGMNLRLLQGLLDGLDDPGWTARLAPGPGRCCVRLDPAARRQGGRS